MKINFETTTVVKHCPFCGKVSSVKVNTEDYFGWENGALAQNAFPYLSASKREILISGMCEECQADFFHTDEEDEED